METETNFTQQPQQTIVIQEPKSNGMGVAGFVLALVGVLLCWVPVLNWILWVLGLVFSIIGVTRKPKGLAITGLVLSFFLLIIDILIATVFAASLAAFL